LFKLFVVVVKYFSSKNNQLQYVLSFSFPHTNTVQGAMLQQSQFQQQQQLPQQQQQQQQMM